MLESFFFFIIVIGGVWLLKNNSNKYSDYERAEELFALRDYPSALLLYEKAAAEGHVLAMAFLGNAYMKGRYAPVNYEQGRMWLEKAAMQKYAPAQNYLGCIYQEGLGVAQDLAKAKHWFEMAAEQNNPEGKANLALMYEKGMNALLHNTNGLQQAVSAVTHVHEAELVMAQPDQKSDEELFEESADAITQPFKTATIQPPVPVKEDEPVQEPSIKDSLPVLPPHLQAYIDQIDEKTQGIKACMADDPRDVKEGTRFLESYQPAVIEIVERYHQFMKHKPVFSTQNTLVEERMEEQLDRVIDAFSKMHQQLLKNDIDDIHTSLNALDNLLEGDGYQEPIQAVPFPPMMKNRRETPEEDKEQ